VVYWHVVFVFMSRVFGYKLVKEISVLEDGTKVAKLVRDNT
jgi:hypothetical protein